MSATPALGNAQQIGRFRVLRTLGRGSEGVVYLAADPTLGREVAIKTTVVDEAANPRIAQLLLSTAKTASRLTHPNIVPVFDAGVHEGCPYVVFEYVAGPTLAALIQEQGALDPARSVAMIRQILDGVAHIHERGLIHGDIKPDNILLSAHDRPRVADFGLLRREDSRQFAATAGTRRYLAPECFEGGATDCRRDVFALGLLLYEMLTGRARVPVETGRDAIAQLMNEMPALPSLKGHGISDEIDAIVMKALQPDPAARYASAGAMKYALDQIATTAEGRGAASTATVDFLLRRMARKSDFPTLSGSVAGINQIVAQSDDASVKTLSDLVIRDFALTQKLLRLVNSAAMGGRNITRVSDAITLVGVGSLRSIATAMMLAASAGEKKSPAIVAALTDAFVAGLIARNTGRVCGLAAVEELFICGMFSPLGELLALNYLEDDYSEITRRVTATGVTPDEAARNVLGIGFDELGVAVARHWKLPAVIIDALAPLPPGAVPVAANSATRIWQCAAYARELCALARISDDDARRAALHAHAQRYAAAVVISAPNLERLMMRSVDMAADYTAAAGLPPTKTAMLSGMSILCAGSAAPAATPVAAHTKATISTPAEDTLHSAETVLAPAEMAWWRRLVRSVRRVFD